MIVAIIIGSDVFVGGAKNIGPTKAWIFLQRYVNEEENDLECIIFNWASDVLKVNFEELEIIMSAILYEPAIEINNEEPFKYINGKPKRLPKYLKYFKRKNDDDIEIFQGPKMTSCVGPDKDRSHMFLYCESAMDCHECKKTVCNTYVRRVDDLNFCLE